MRVKRTMLTNLNRLSNRKKGEPQSVKYYNDGIKANDSQTSHQKRRIFTRNILHVTEEAG